MNRPAQSLLTNGVARNVLANLFTRLAGKVTIIADRAGERAPMTLGGSRMDRMAVQTGAIGCRPIHMAVRRIQFRHGLPACPGCLTVLGAMGIWPFRGPEGAPLRSRKRLVDSRKLLSRARKQAVLCPQNGEAPACPTALAPRAPSASDPPRGGTSNNRVLVRWQKRHSSPWTKSGA